MPAWDTPDNIDLMPHRPVLFQQAIAELTRRGMTVRVAISREAHPRGDGHRVDGVVRQGIVHHDGARWVVVLDGRRVRVANLVGMRYLAELLTRPGQSIPALTLASRGMARRSSSRHELLDDEARAAYRARAQELTTELAEAEANNDLVRAERFRLELDALIDELESASGLGRRPRRFTDPAERARSAVSKAIKRAIDVVDDASPAIADVLRDTIQCGTMCSYVPDPTSPISWSIRPPDHTAPVEPFPAPQTINWLMSVDSLVLWLTAAHALREVTLAVGSD